MPILPIPSLNALLNRVVITVNKTAITFSPAILGKKNNRQKYYQKARDNSNKDLLDEQPTGLRKILNYQPIAQYQQHKLHYVLKGIGYLPTPFLEGLIGYLNGPTTKQYRYANSHLRLIIAVNNKLKRPLQLAQLHRLRQRFAVDAVAMQAPKVWQQVNTYQLSNGKPITKKAASTVSWEDKIIANADGGDMTVRCYQSAADYKKKPNQGNKQYPDNGNEHDNVAMLFFHGGGFCIGDVNTHHEFCHAVCAQTGWTVVSVDYRLAPEHPAPTALRDCIAAYAWLAEHCHNLGASSSRIVLAGDSAGGCLSTLVARYVTAPTETPWLDLGLAGHQTNCLLQNLPPPIAQLPLYPVTDIDVNYPSWGLYGKGLLLDHDDIAVFDAAYMQDSPLPRHHVLLSPMLGDNSQVCATYVVAAELDILRDEALAYAEQLQSHGIDVHTHTVLGAPHGFIHFMSIHQGLENETNYIINDFASFLRQIISLKADIAA